MGFCGFLPSLSWFRLIVTGFLTRILGFIELYLVSTSF